jgi:hypothetical protein
MVIHNPSLSVISLMRQSILSPKPSSGCTALPKQQKCDLINAFWPHMQLSSKNLVEEDYVDLFTFFELAFRSVRAHHTSFAVQEPEGLVAFVKVLREQPHWTKHAIMDEIQKTYLNIPTEAIARTLELASRLWLGINICSATLAVGHSYPRDTRIEWPSNQSPKELIAEQFTQKPFWVTSEDCSLDDSFTAASLKNVCRLHIRWTDNLVDHLQLKGRPGQRILSIYRHKICLVNHLRDPKRTAINSDILEEAIRTLDLLFPIGDSPTADFLKAEGVHFYSIPPCDKTQPIDLNDFKYWRNNLMQLLKLLNGPPETVTQTLLDTRNVPQFATLWVAIVGVFSLTIIFGILATVYSIKQYDVAVASYKLAVALACHEFPELSGYCPKT